MISNATKQNVNKFLGLDIILNRLRSVEQALGLRKSDPLPTHANNAAALTAGLKPGDRYVTGSGSYMIVHE